MSSGYYYLRARYYAPETGRFISEDPAYAGTNYYNFCSNDAINQIDPSGLESYILYDKDAAAGQKGYYFRDEAEIMRKRIKSMWNSECYKIPVTSADDFKKKWNNSVGFKFEKGKPTKTKTTVDVVYIILHGSIAGVKNSAIGFAFFNDRSVVAAKKSNYFPPNSVSVWDLKVKEIKFLMFSTCNSGNPDCYNLAKAFIDHMPGISYLSAWDGGTVFDYSDNGGTLKVVGTPGDIWEKFVPIKSAEYSNSGGFTIYNPARDWLKQRVYNSTGWTSYYPTRYEFILNGYYPIGYYPSIRG